MNGAVEASNKFCVDLHSYLRSERQFTGENLFYSPSSLSIALAMTSMGARGNTAEQLNKALHWEGLSQDKLHDNGKEFLVALQESNTKGNELTAANGLFVQKDYPLSRGFSEGIKKFYDARIASVDYQNDAEGARREVNKWVEEKTEQKIKNLIAEGVFNSLTKLTLVNAIYFKGFWQKEFDKRATYDQKFFVSTREKIQVRMMHLKASFKLHKADTYKVLEMPYKGNDFSMIILLPHKVDGLVKLEEDLTYDKLQRAIESVTEKSERVVKVSLPRFKVTQQFLLNDILAKMGAEDMFSKFADFAGITPGSEKLYVSHVIHKAFVEVNEKSTEAAAATAAVIRLRSATRRRSYPKFRADHPFLFIIYHKKSNAILFMGRTIKPECHDE